MTKILKLEMRGFKSFANKTDILFADDFNCVLGPNGSGKSNILDALCFVLGKSSSKEMRAEKSANLIYNGGKTKTPAKEGEVSIYFDNTTKEFNNTDAEIKVTRIIRHSGQSVYKINNKTMTRQQILDYLAKARINPDGYNIILQGDIVRLIEMSSVERRQIVEEIAGISVYEEKKMKALRELQRVDEKANEAEIILAERKAYLGELKDDRDKAMKFKDLDDKIKRNKATLIDNDMQDRKKKVDKLNKEIDATKKQTESADKEIQQAREKITEKKKQIEELNHEVEEKGEKENIEIQREVEKLKVDIAVGKQRISTLQQELDKIVNRRKELSENFKEIDGKLKIIETAKQETDQKIKLKEAELQKVEGKIGEFKKKNKMENATEIDKQIEELDKAIEKAQEEINRLREQQQNLLREKDKSDTKLQGIDEKLQKILSLEKENKGQLEKLKQMQVEFKKASNELSKALAEDSSLAAQLSTAQTKLYSRREEHSKLAAKSAGMRENIAGGEAIKEVLGLGLKGVYGLVSELGDVKSEHALALEVSAGPRLRSIVVDTDETASKCIAHLKKNKSGVATFIPLNKIRTTPPDARLKQMKGQGIVGLALELVSYDKRYEKAFEHLFGSTLVVEDIETARRLGIGSARMVTLSGDLVETSGTMQGGFRQRQREIGFIEKEVKDQLRGLEAELADLESVTSRLTQKRKDNEELITRLRDFKANMEADIIKLEKTLRLDEGDMGADKEEKTKLRKEIESLDKQIDTAANQIGDRNKDLASLKTKKQSLRDQINQLRNPALLAELQSYEQKKTELKEEIGTLRQEIKNSESEKTTILGPERENVQKIFKQLDREEKNFDIEKKELSKLIDTQEKDLKIKEDSQKKFYQKFRELFSKRSKLDTEINKIDDEILKKNEDTRKTEMKMNAVSIDNAKIKAELAGLEVEFRQYEGVPLYKNKPLEEIRKEISDFERMMENIGAVNMRALEIYDSVEKEYFKLTEKREKLLKEKEDVLLMINEVDSKKKELFMRTFDVVNHNFKEIFVTLSNKGVATLELEDQNDPFAAGLNIKVKLTGKKFLDIRSLSGGEKTMTALAFIFAVQEHEPASFYIFDEVDAALDKKNSERLAKLVKEYSKRAQYIIITHNDGVIGEASCLYGISMNEHGVSKITTLKV